MTEWVCRLVWDWSTWRAGCIRVCLTDVYFISVSANHSSLANCTWVIASWQQRLRHWLVTLRRRMITEWVFSRHTRTGCLSIQTGTQTAKCVHLSQLSCQNSTVCQKLRQSTGWYKPWKVLLCMVLAFTEQEILLAWSMLLQRRLASSSSLKVGSS